jgi:PAS domain S-box-containing protein
MGDDRSSDEKDTATPPSSSSSSASSHRFERHFLDAIVDSVADPIFVKDDEHRWVVLNRAMEALFGRSREELLGKSDFEFFPEEEARVFWEKDRVVLETGEVNENEENFTDAEGVTHTISTKKQRFFDEDGKPHLVGVIRDISQQKETERTLLEAKEVAESGARAKSEFLANVSHELRTPLNAILGMTTLLLETNLDDKQEDYARTIRDSSDVLLTLINDLLDLVKTDSHRIELEELAFDVPTCVERAVALLSPRAREKGLEISVEIDESVPPAVVGDVTRIRQVLLNLLSNAVKFTERGSVAVRATARPIDDDRVCLRLEVEDTGIGIPEDRLDRLFIPFSQLDPSTTRRYGGTGLGLALSRRLAERMGGTLEVRSRERRGSTFGCELPLRVARDEGAAPDAEVLPGDDLSELGARHRLRILIAEDNHVSQKVARLILRRFGYEADVAADGQEVLDLLTLRSYDVVLMDVHMPLLDGLAVTERIRARPSDFGAPWIVGVTASALPEDVERCFEAGMNAHLAKPVRPQALYDALLEAPSAGDRS